MPQMHYGLRSPVHARALAKQVVNVLGGGDIASSLLLETACAETQLGTYPDSHPDKWGVGVNQHDQINLDDIQAHGKQRHFELINNAFGYDMKTVKLTDLALDPLLSFICCRLSYLRIPAPIPTELYGRACYWKEYYNRSGKGTVKHYLDSVAHCLGEQWQ